jgi:hypothetical protein
VEIKRRLNSGNTCYRSVGNLLSSRLLYKNVKSEHIRIILPVVLYRCETWSLTLRGEHRPRVFENKVLLCRLLTQWPTIFGHCDHRLRGIFGPKGDEVTGGWRNVHYEGFRDLYSSPSIIRIIKSNRVGLAGRVARMGIRGTCYRLMVGKPEGKRPLGKKTSGSGTGSTQPREYNWGATWLKSGGSCLENRECGRRDPSRWPCGTIYPQKLAITSPTSGCRSVGIVRSMTQTMEFSLVRKTNT